MDTLGSAGFLRLAGHVTVRQILERDDFQQRLETNRLLIVRSYVPPRDGIRLVVSKRMSSLVARIRSSTC